MGSPPAHDMWYCMTNKLESENDENIAAGFAWVSPDPHDDDDGAPGSEDHRQQVLLRVCLCLFAVNRGNNVQVFDFLLLFFDRLRDVDFPYLAYVRKMQMIKITTEIDRGKKCKREWLFTNSTTEYVRGLDVG